MTIKEFVESASKVTSDGLKTKRINGMLNTKPYVGVAEKIALAEKVTNAGTREHDKDGNVIGFKINSLTKYILHIMGIIELYTDLTVDYNNVLSEYDALKSNGYIEAILQQIGESEITECQFFLDMLWSDAIQNTFSTHAFIKDQVTRFCTLAGATLSPMIESLTKAVEGLDDEKVKAIVEAIGKKG